MPYLIVADRQKKLHRFANKNSYRRIYMAVLREDMDRTRQRLIGTLAKTLNLTKTASAILELLVKTREKMSVTQIVKKLKVSERSVRKHLVNLVKRGVLRREIIVTKSKKLAYLYSLGPLETLFVLAKRELTKSMERIESIALRLKERAEKVRS